MLRGILGVIAGYAAMFFVVFVVFTGVYLALGADGAFKEGSYEVSTVWLVQSFVVSFVAALIGGMVCKLIARGSTAPRVLAGIVLVLGLLVAALTLGSDEADEVKVRTADVGNFEAMTNAKEPAITLWANPFIGMIGVLVGACLVKGGSKSAAGGA